MSKTGLLAGRCAMNPPELIAYLPVATAISWPADGWWRKPRAGHQP